MKHQSFWMWCAATGASLAVVGGAASAALAQNRPVTVTGTRSDEDRLSVHVRHSDLNLVSAAGERTLNRRVGSATRKVCMPLDLGGAPGKRIVSSCKEFAWNGARPQIASAVLRAREIAATGTSAIPAVAIAISVPN